MPDLNAPTIPMLFFEEGIPPHGLWMENFGPYLWFYIPLIGRMIARSGLTVSKVLEQRSAVVSYGGNQLSRVFPWGQWDQLSPSQVRTALSGRLVRLDKAVLTIACTFTAIHGEKALLFGGLEEIFSRLGVEVSILPSCTVVDLINNIDGRRVRISQNMLHEIGQPGRLSDEIYSSYGVTDFLFRQIFNLFISSDSVIVERRLLLERRDDIVGYLSRPAKFQQYGNNNYNNILNYLNIYKSNNGIIKR